MMMKLLKWNCVVGLLLLGLSAQAQEIKVNAKLDKTSILLGDQTVLRLSAELPLKAKLNFPLLADTLSAKVLIVSAGKADTLKDQNRPDVQVISRAYTITSFDAGLQMVPSLVFEASSGAKYSTDALPLDVKAVKVDTTKAIYDIKQPLAVSYGFMDWLRDEWPKILLAVAFVLALVLGWRYYWKQRGKKPVVKKSEPVLAPHTIALNQLHALKNKQLWQQGEVKGYYSELTDILRSYLEQRFEIHAQEQTSDEILLALKETVLSPERRYILKESLQLADLVKFAKARPLAQENEDSLGLAIRFVEGTQFVKPKMEDSNGVV